MTFHVAVQIVTYNSSEYIEECINAVLTQTYPIYSILVVDNGSTDQTRDILQKYKDRVDIIFNEQNIGFAAAHNQAIRYHSAAFYLILNPDVILHPDYLYNLFHFYENHSQLSLGSLTGKLLRANKEGKLDSCGLRITKARRAFDIGNGEDEQLYTSPLEVFGVSGAAALYSKSMIEDISFEDQFYDESFFAYKEDIDVAWRGRIAGWTSYYVPSAIGYHERGWKERGRKSQPWFIRKHSYINRYRMIIKNESILIWICHLWRIVPYECSSFLYALLIEPKLLTSWVNLFVDIPRLMKWRIYTQSIKKSKNVQIYKFFE